MSVTDAPALFARQPILNRKKEVIAYELLFRPQDQLGTIDGSLATAQVVLSTFTEVTATRTSGGLPMFINFNEQWLLQEVPFQPDEVVIEILEDVVATPALIAAVKKKSLLGFRFALDDFHSSLSTAAFLPFASYIKVDVLNITEEQLVKTIKAAQYHNMSLLAERVETPELFKKYNDLGFEYFQGYFFSKPETITGTVAKPIAPAAMRVLGSLLAEEVDIDELEQHLKASPDLSTKLLRILNSAHYLKANPVTSIKSAIMTIGLESMQRWVTLIVMSGLQEKPSILLKMTLIRAAMLEKLAEHNQFMSSNSAYLLGLFSNLDAYLDTPMPELMRDLPIAESLKNALIAFEGEGGKALAITIAIEQADWDFLDTVENHEQLHQYFECYLSATLTAQDILTSLGYSD